MLTSESTRFNKDTYRRRVATEAAQLGPTTPLTIIVTDRSGACVMHWLGSFQQGTHRRPMDRDSKGHLTLNLRPGGERSACDRRGLTYAGLRLADLPIRAGAALGSELRGEALANYIATGSERYQTVTAPPKSIPAFTRERFSLLTR